MSSKSKCGLNKEQRQAFLRGHGYELAPNRGKGSHEVWFNKALQRACLKKGLSMPQNLKSNPEQVSWSITLPADPALGTWERIEKQIRWGVNTVTGSKQQAEQSVIAAALSEQFHKTLTDIVSWKRAVKMWLKAGPDTGEYPVAPAAYHSYHGGKSDLFKSIVLKNV